MTFSLPVRIARLGNGRGAARVIALWLVVAAPVWAEGYEFALADAQLARLGIALAWPVAVSEMEIASAPTEVVVPPARQAVISAPVNGLVARILVDAGETVTRGQALAELQGPEVLSWQRDYLDARLEDELATSQHSRDQSLYDEGIIAERRLQESRARARASQARLDQAQRQLELAGFTGAALAELGEGGSLAERLVLRSPLDGVVLERLTSVGARVGALDPLMRLGDLSELWLELQVRQELAADVLPGMLVSVLVGGQERRSTITTVGRFVDDTTQSVLVRAVLEQADHRLKAGQYLNSRIVAPLSSGTALALPAAAVTRHLGKTYVFARRENAIEVVPVELLADDGARVYVAARSLDANTRLAVEGISVLKSLWLAED
ncbi:MAG: efflux RND transporter periplasmic adaptor subunit [Gammaproteobacteria bacterium]|nr:efflux RND transporter periplasmic adaptor subunit [Gammaproteobacteria bacterium]